MGNQSQKKSFMDQFENVDEIRVYKGNSHDSDVECDEIRDRGSTIDTEEMGKEMENNMDNNECNVSLSDPSKDDEISKCDDRTREDNDNDCFMHEPNSENKDESYHKPKSYANVVQKNEIQLDTSLDFTPTVINEDGVEFVIFDDEIVAKAKGPWIVSNKHIFVQKWDPFIGMKEVDVTKIPVWAKLMNIPLEAWIKRRSKDNVIKGTKKVKVEYVWKLVICSQCKVFGHRDEKCMKVKRTVVDNAQENGKNKESIDVEDVDGFTEVKHRKNNEFIKNDRFGGNQWIVGKRNVWNRNETYKKKEKEVVSDDEEQMKKKGSNLSDKGKDWTIQHAVDKALRNSQNTTSKRKSKIPVKFNNHIMGNQSQKKSFMDQFENVDEIRVYKGNSHDSDVECDEIRDRGSTIDTEEMGKEMENNMDNNECNVSLSDPSKDDEISKCDDRTREDNDNDCFMHEPNSENKDESYHKPKSYANVVQKNEIQLDTSLDFTPTVINEDGVEFVIFDDEIVAKAKGPWIVSNKHIFVQKWDPFIGMKEVDVTKIPVWAKLMNIPLEAWIKRRSKDNVIKGTKKVKVEYVWKLVICSQCKVFGHRDEKCMKVKRTVVDNAQENGKNKESIDVEDVDGFTEVKHRKNNEFIKNDRFGGNQWIVGKRNVWNRNETYKKKEKEVVSDDEEQMKKKGSNLSDKGKDWTIQHAVDKALRNSQNTILVGWDKDKVSLMVLNMTKQSMFCILGTVDIKKRCFFSFMYASNNGKEMRILWNEINAAKIIENEKPWCLLGDFNVTIKTEEHSSR
nr:hypothetical protein [Tanacetum cinerariifolium]